MEGANYDYTTRAGADWKSLRCCRAAESHDGDSRFSRRNASSRKVDVREARRAGPETPIPAEAAATDPEPPSGPRFPSEISSYLVARCRTAPTVAFPLRSIPFATRRKNAPPSSRWFSGRDATSPEMSPGFPNASLWNPVDPGEADTEIPGGRVAYRLRCRGSVRGLCVCQSTTPAVDAESGRCSASGRWKSASNQAFQYAFTLAR
jgi:hypothetical protein